MTAPGRPQWVYRVQQQGLTPAVLEKYLSAGWPVEAIAEDRHLEVEDIKAAIQRWEMETADSS